MSIVNYSLSILTLSPKIKIESGKISVKKSIISNIITLGLNHYSAVINQRFQEVKFSKRICYFFASSYSINLKNLHYIDYSYSETPTSFTLDFRAADSVEKFTIKLVDKTGKKHFLGNFRGEGAKMTGVSGAILGDSFIDYSGTQETESRNFVTFLERTLKIPVGKPNAYENFYSRNR